jgi:UDP:flavonoid glycosyltransferase YjiC (YdhE family)
MLMGYSPLVLPKPEDWDDWLHVTGYWFHDHGREWVPPRELAHFLDSGPPPVFVGFGSMSNRDPGGTTRLVLNAMAACGQRGVFQAGWGGLRQADLPEGVLTIGAVPHDWLFPQMAAVVHHGGAGTTAAGLRAGVPTVVVPFFGDQHFWGQRVNDLGLGPPPVPRKRLTAERLARALQVALGDEAVRDNAARMGAAIRAEDGVGRAVEIIERYVHDRCR